MKNLPVVRRIEDLNDFYEIMEIENKVFQNPYTLDVYLSDYLHHPYSQYFKLVLNQAIIGYVGLWVIDEKVQITTIAVSDAYQGLGYGDLLMNFIIQYVNEKRCINITLEVRVSNRVAIEFYKKHGFIIVCKRKRYYQDGEDAYLMKLDII